MRVTTILLLVLLGVLTLFAVLNWTAVTAPTALSVGFTTIDAPLGLVLLVASAMLTAVFLGVILIQQATAFADARRSAKDLHAQREIADKAEASRLAEVRASLEAALRKIDVDAAAARAEEHARLARLEEAVIARVAEVENALSAHLAELEDKLDRAVGGAAGDHRMR
jgi:uncharacterized integral membrane protein